MLCCGPFDSLRVAARVLNYTLTAETIQSEMNESIP